LGFPAKKEEPKPKPAAVAVNTPSNIPDTKLPDKKPTKTNVDLIPEKNNNNIQKESLGIIRAEKTIPAAAAAAKSQKQSTFGDTDDDDIDFFKKKDPLSDTKSTSKSTTKSTTTSTTTKSTTEKDIWGDLDDDPLF